MFSHGSCVWVTHLAGQLDKQRCTLSSYDVSCAQLNTVNSFVFMLAWAMYSMVCFITLLPLAHIIDIKTACNFLR